VGIDETILRQICPILYGELASCGLGLFLLPNPPPASAYCSKRALNRIVCPVILTKMLSSPVILPEVIAQRLGQGQQPAIVLGCDSVLAINGEIHGKPDSPAEAISRWQYMRGRVGELYTGHALIYLGKDEPRRLVRCGMTQVHFAKPTDHQIEAYVASGEPLNCAGCFALEGKGSLFVERLEGCHTNVIGLSMPLLRQMLSEMEIDVTDFW
jgi:septum formation protein